MDFNRRAGMRNKDRGRSRTIRRKTVRVIRSARFLGRRTKQMIMLLADFVALPAALWTAVILRHGTIDPPGDVPSLLFIASVVVTVPLFVRFGLYRAVIRFLGIHAVMVISIGAAISALALYALDRFVLGYILGAEVFVIYFLLALTYLGISRFGARELLRLDAASAEYVIIYGAGVAGAQLCSALTTSGRFRPVAIVDDNTKLCGARVNGFLVY